MENLIIDFNKLTETEIVIDDLGKWIMTPCSDTKTLMVRYKDNFTEKFLYTMKVGIDLKVNYIEFDNPNDVVSYQGAYKALLTILKQTHEEWSKIDIDASANNIVNRPRNLLNIKTAIVEENAGTAIAQENTKMLTKQPVMKIKDLLENFIKLNEKLLDATEDSNWEFIPDYATKQWTLLPKDKQVEQSYWFSPTQSAIRAELEKELSTQDKEMLTYVESFLKANNLSNRLTLMYLTDVGYDMHQQVYLNNNKQTGLFSKQQYQLDIEPRRKFIMVRNKDHLLPSYLSEVTFIFEEGELRLRNTQPSFLSKSEIESATVFLENWLNSSVLSDEEIKRRLDK